MHKLGAPVQLPMQPEDGDHEQRIAERLDRATDRQLARWLAPAERRLQVVENGLADLRARIPSLEREAKAVRQNVEAVRVQLQRPAA